MKSPAILPFLVGAIVAVSLWGNGGRSCAPDSLLGGLGALVGPSAALAADIEGQAAPGFTLRDLDGNEVSLDQFDGKVVLIDFWATWCPPCREGIPGLVELQEDMGDDGLVVIGISLDDGPEVVRDFAKEFGINYPLVMGNQEVSNAYGGVSAIPTAFLIDRDGTVVMRHVGLASKEMLADKIKPLL